MKKLGVIANCGKPRAAAVLKVLADRASELGVVLYASGETASMLQGAAVDSDFSGVDGVIALGGDGTMLTAVRELQGLNKPLIGVNIGSLGFMTSVAEEDLPAALECLHDETFSVSERVVWRVRSDRKISASRIAP